MRATFILLVLFLSTGFATPSICGTDEPSDLQSKIGIDEILFASLFITATEDDFMISTYLRTSMKEGEFPTDLKEVSDTAERFLVFRLGRFGATFGWPGEDSPELLEPHVLAADYKLPLLDREEGTSFAMDFKFSTRKTTESSLRRSLLDFGVFSITALASKRVAAIFEPYGGVMMNYIYVDAAAAELTYLWRMVPFIGTRIDLGFRNTQIVFELNRGRANRSEDPMLTWHLGVSIKF